MKTVRLDAEAIRNTAAARGIDYMSEVARRADMDPSTLHRLLSGTRDARPSHVLAIARAVHAKPSELVAEVDDDELLRLLDARAAADDPEAQGVTS